MELLDTMWSIDSVQVQAALVAAPAVEPVPLLSRMDEGNMQCRSTSRFQSLSCKQGRYKELYKSSFRHYIQSTYLHLKIVLLSNGTHK